MSKKKVLSQKNKVGKRILFGFLCVAIVFLLLCAIKIYQIQHYSILAESNIKHLKQYESVLLGQHLWMATESLDDKDLIKLYFILGSTRRYNKKKHRKYVPDGEKLIYPQIIFMTGDSVNDPNGGIVWEYYKNLLYVTDDGTSIKEPAYTYYYIDKKHAEMLHKLYDKYNRLGDNLM